MCGIAGMLAWEPGRTPGRDGLSRMARALRHRGPDDEGLYVSGPVGLVHRRLSIIDLVAGHQPMSGDAGRAWVVFNGEIYNFPELRAYLEGRGHTFQTRSDTEVLLQLFLEHGLDAFPQLNGMFACAFWNERTQELVLARDRLGKKPLYYREDGSQLLFGSEIKAILAYGGFDRKVHPGALREYLTFGYINGEQTIVDGIRRLMPGHLLVARAGTVVTRPYWEFNIAPNRTALPEQEAVEELGAILARSVKRRLLSDVPLGAFLSGGIDSSSIVALMARGSERPVRTFSIGFEEAGYSELEDARAVAQHLGTEHHETIVRPSAFKILPELVWHLDEPFGDSSSIPTYYVCRAARSAVTVALSGDGGDEMFAGYTRYRDLEQLRRLESIPTWIRKGLAGSVVSRLPLDAPAYNYLYRLAHWTRQGRPGSMGLFPFIGEKLLDRRILHEPMTRAGFESAPGFWERADALDPVSRYQYLDTLYYLPGDILTKVDRMSMAVSLEVRSPLLDYEVVDFMARLPVSLKLRDGVTKYLLRKVSAKLLPDSVLTKRKQGFALPKGAWFRRELREASEEILLDPRALARGYYREAVLRRMLRHHYTGARDYSTWIWCLIVLEMWHRLYIDPSTRSV